MSRVHTMARFDEEIREPTIVPVTCDYDCGHDIHVGDTVIQTHDGEVIHEDCWRDYCDEMYRAKSGEINEKGAVI